MSHPGELQLFAQEGDSIPPPRPPLPSLPTSTGNEVKEFNLDLPLFWLPWRRHAARLDAAAAFSPISKRTAKAQTVTARKSGTDTRRMSVVGGLHPPSRCAQPGRWRDAERPVARAEGCQYKHAHVCTCADTRVHAYTRVYLLHGTAVSFSFRGAGWCAAAGRGCLICGDPHRD